MYHIALIFLILLMYTNTLWSIASLSEGFGAFPNVGLGYPRGYCETVVNSYYKPQEKDVQVRAKKVKEICDAARRGELQRLVLA